MTQTKTAKFDFDRETKNTLKFEEVEVAGEPKMIGSLYVQKWFAGDARRLEVTLTTS